LIRKWVLNSNGKESFEGSRSTSGSRPRPSIASEVIPYFVVDPIIRGHSLRRFVEERTAEDRYADIANWLNLAPFVALQRNLRSLRQQAKAAAEDSSLLKRVDGQLARETDKAVVSWDEAAVLEFINTQLVAPLDANLSLAKLDRADPALLILIERARLEEQQVGLAGLRQVHRAATSLYREIEEHQPSRGASEGLIPEFEAAVRTMLDAQVQEESERTKAANSIFAELWKAAEAIFAEEGEPIETSPLCATPIENTKAGSALGIREHIATHLVELHDYATAKNQLDEAAAGVASSKGKLLAGLQAILPLVAGIDAKLESALADYSTAVQTWTANVVPDSALLKASLHECSLLLATRIAKIEAEQGETTYTKACTKIDRLISLNDERLMAEDTSAQLGMLSASLTDQASFISRAIREKWRPCSTPCENPQTKSTGRYRARGLFRSGSNYRPKRT
jgi:hypothetical protein